MDDTDWDADDADHFVGDGGYDEEDFDYEEFLEREFPGHASSTPQRALRRAFVMIVVLVLIGLMLLGSLLGP